MSEGVCNVITQDGVAMLWDLAEGKRLYSLDAGDIIHALCFSPNRYWLCAATQSCIKVGRLSASSFVDHTFLLGPSSGGLSEFVAVADHWMGLIPHINTWCPWHPLQLLLAQ